MELIKNKNRTTLTQAALGKIQCDLALENVKLVNVITGEIYPAGVDIINGVIARIRMHSELPNAKRVVDCHQHYLCPAFIDTHMHVESTMMTPENFGKAAVQWGTGIAVTDPHEIANVMGVNGVKFMLESAKNSPLRILTLVPSCVPAVPSVESAGASFTDFEVYELLQEEDVIGIAEVMDYLGVINDDKRMHDIIHVGKSVDGFIQGHAPYVTGDDLCAYLCGGPVSDHEVRVATELQEKLRMGMHVNIKSSSLSDTVQEFINGIKDIPIHDFVSLCTDDVHAADLLTTGHINHIVNECIKGGIDPIDAIRFGTINAARELKLEDCGAIAPSYIANLQLVDNLQFDKKPSMVIIEGKIINNIEEDYKTEHFSINTVHIPQIKSPKDFYIKATGNEDGFLVFNASRTAMTPNQELVYKKFPIIDGHVVIENTNENQFVSIINRYGSGDITTVVCSDFHLMRGCIASTISHDSHNMTIVFKDVNDAFIAAKYLEKVGGGMCFVENGEVKYSLPLPVAGLMSELPAEELSFKIRAMDKWVNYASDGKSPMLLAIAILALPVRPGIIITDRGIVRGETLQFIPQTI